MRSSNHLSKTPNAAVVAVAPSGMTGCSNTSVAVSGPAETSLAPSGCIWAALPYLLQIQVGGVWGGVSTRISCSTLRVLKSTLRCRVLVDYFHRLTGSPGHNVNSRCFRASSDQTSISEIVRSTSSHTITVRTSCTMIPSGSNTHRATNAHGTRTRARTSHGVRRAGPRWNPRRAGAPAFPSRDALVPSRVSMPQGMRSQAPIPADSQQCQIKVSARHRHAGRALRSEAYGLGEIGKNAV